MKTGFDVVVVGAGMMGSAAARHLSDQGASVAVIGPREPVNRATHDGPFSSHFDEARITRKLDRNADWSRLSARSIARYRALEDRTGVRFFYEQGAIMAVAHDHRSPQIADGVRATNTNEGIGARLYDEEHAQKVFPYLRFPDRTLIAHEPVEAGFINPRAHVGAQMVAATSSGAVWFEEPAVSVRERADVAQVTLASGQTVEAATAVVACGGYTGQGELLPEPLPLRVLARTIAFAELDATACARLSDMPSIVYFVPDGDHDVYVLPPVRYPDGKTYLKIGGDRVDRTLNSVTEMTAWFQGDGDEGVGRYLLDELDRLIPDLAPMSTHFESCATTYTTTGLPYIFHQSARIVVLTGGNGAGAKNADEVGRLGARLALDGSIADEGYSCAFGL